MIIHLYYNLGKLLYSFLSNRNRKFYIYETIGVLATIAIITLIKYVLFPEILSSEIKSIGTKKLFISLFYSFLFFSTALCSRFFSQSIPEETMCNDDFIKKNGNKGKAKKFKEQPKVFVGIVDFTWLAIMSLTYAGLAYVITFDSISAPLISGKTLEYYNLYYDEVKYLFQESINIAIILGTILAACMAILWGEAIWRKRDPESMINYKGTTLASMKMVIAFFIIVFSELLWISLPLYQKMTNIKDFL